MKEKKNKLQRVKAFALNKYIHTELPNVLEDNDSYYHALGKIKAYSEMMNFIEEIERNEDEK